MPPRLLKPIENVVFKLSFHAALALSKSLHALKFDAEDLARGLARGVARGVA